MAPVEVRGGATGTVAIEVVYSPGPGAVDRVVLTLPAGTTVAQGLEASGVFARHPAAAQAVVGVWGRLAQGDQPLRERDRIELYRPLQVDPKEARRLRYRGQGGRRCTPR